MARGGYRPGSGPKVGTKYKPRQKKSVPVDSVVKPESKKPDIPQDIKQEAAILNLTPLEYMLQVMNDVAADPIRRDRMAQAAAPFVHARKGEGQGKKEERENKAKSAGIGKFSSGRAPLSVVK